MMKWQTRTLSQSIENCNLVGRLMKFTPLQPWDISQIYLVSNISTSFNLLQKTYHAEIVNVITGSKSIVELDNGFAVALFSKD